MRPARKGFDIKADNIRVMSGRDGWYFLNQHPYRYTRINAVICLQFHALGDVTCAAHKSKRVQCQDDIWMADHRH